MPYNLRDFIVSVTSKIQAGKFSKPSVILHVAHCQHCLFSHVHRWGKGTCYEEDVKVPFLIRGPGIKPGQPSGYQASNVDIAPTLVVLAGGKVPEESDGLPLPIPPLEKVRYSFLRAG